MLAEIVRIARDQQVDAVLIAGDLYETVGAVRRRRSSWWSGR